jgi:hypothetical protein
VKDRKIFVCHCVKVGFCQKPSFLLHPCKLSTGHFYKSFGDK